MHILDKAGLKITKNVSVTDWSSLTRNERRSIPSESVLPSKGASQLRSWTRKTRNPAGISVRGGKYIVVSFPDKHTIHERVLFRSHPNSGETFVFLWELTARRQTNRSFVSRWPNKPRLFLFSQWKLEPDVVLHVSDRVLCGVRTVASSMSRVQSEHVRTKIERTGVCKWSDEVFRLKTNNSGNITLGIITYVDDNNNTSYGKKTQFQIFYIRKFPGGIRNVHGARSTGFIPNGNSIIKYYRWSVLVSRRASAQYARHRGR